MTRLQALLFGLGQIGCGYDLELPFQADQPSSGEATLSHARALACHPQVQLMAAIDPDAEARRRFERCYGVKAFACLNYWRRAMPNAAVDLAVVAVPAVLQPLLVEELLYMLAPRLLLLEKPVAISCMEGERLRRACATQPQLQVAVNYIRRYLPEVLKLQQRLQAGDLGHLLHGRLVYGKGLLSNGSHFVNLAEAWLGPLYPGSCMDPGEAFAGFDRDASLTLLAHRHGDASLLVQSVGGAGLRAGELDLWFSKGRLRWENDGKTISVWSLAPAVPGESHRSLEAEPERMATGLKHYQHHVLHSLVRRLLEPERSPLHCTLVDGLQTLEILERALDAGE